MYNLLPKNEFAEKAVMIMILNNLPPRQWPETVVILRYWLQGKNPITIDTNGWIAHGPEVEVI